MEPFVTRIGDVTIERVVPKSGKEPKDSIPAPSVSLAKRGVAGAEDENIGDGINVSEDLQIFLKPPLGDLKESAKKTSDRIDNEQVISDGRKGSSEMDKMSTEDEGSDEDSELEEDGGREIEDKSDSESESSIKMKQDSRGEKSEAGEKNTDDCGVGTVPLTSGEPTLGEGDTDIGGEMADSNKRKASDSGATSGTLKKKSKNSGKDGSKDKSGSKGDPGKSSSSSESDDNTDDEQNKTTMERKLSNMRRNIREVMNESQLDEETLAAQRQEMERLRRVQEQQRIIREVQRQIALNRQNNKTQTRVISLLQGNSSILKQIPGTSGSSGTQVRLPNTVLVKLASSTSGSTSSTNTTTQSNKKVFELLRVQKGAGRGTSATTRTSSMRALSKSRMPGQVHMMTPSVSIAPVMSSGRGADPGSDSESEGEDDSDRDAMARAALRKVAGKPKGKDVVTISSSSDDDDCILLSEPSSGDEGDPVDDPTNSGMHTNDLYNVPDEQGRVLVNVGHPPEETDIFLASQIARVIKPHQIGGVRFLFDNVVESVERFNTSTGFGCILAHSMGLGKTLQVVSFCDVFLRHTKARNVLCIMPINTLQNWLAEFNMWLPHKDPDSSPLAVHGEVRPRNFPLHVLNDSHKSMVARSKVIQEWDKDGGVLLIGYELYRQLSLKRSHRGKKKRKKNSDVVDVDADDKNKLLLDDIYSALVKPGPDLVICDEGHRIKNSHASISQALKQIRSKRRVVLTGYPLQNNLLEYWCMVDFVRPNYLGTKTEFCNMFERPIQNGQCIDSTPQDIRLMRYRAHVLHSLLEGFVQRRSHSVLQVSLPQKEEYVLLLRMTSFQRKLYDTFMNEVVRTKAVPNPLKAFAVCCKIWNHPDVLYYFLKKRAGGEDVDLDLEEATAAVATPLAGTATTVLPKTPAKRGRGRGARAAQTNKRDKKAAAPLQPGSTANKPAATIIPNNTNLNSDSSVMGMGMGGIGQHSAHGQMTGMGGPSTQMHSQLPHQQNQGFNMMGHQNQSYNGGSNSYHNLPYQGNTGSSYGAQGQGGYGSSSYGHETGTSNYGNMDGHNYNNTNYNSGSQNAPSYGSGSSGSYYPQTGGQSQQTGYGSYYPPGSNQQGSGEGSYQCNSNNSAASGFWQNNQNSYYQQQNMHSQANASGGNGESQYYSNNNNSSTYGNAEDSPYYMDHHQGSGQNYSGMYASESFMNDMGHMRGSRRSPNRMGGAQNMMGRNAPNQIANQSGNIQNTISNLQSQMGNTQNQLANLQNQMGSSQTQMDNLQNTVGNSQSQMGNPQNTMGNSQSPMSNIQNQMGNLQNQMGNTQNQMSNPQNIMANLQNQMGNPQNHMSSPQNQLGNLQNQMGTPQNQMGNPQNQMGNPQNQMGNPQNQMGNPQNQMGNPQNQMGNPQNQMTTPQNQMGNPQNQMGNPQNQMGNPQNQMGNPQNQMINPQNLMTNPQNQMTNPQNQMGNPQNQIGNLQNQINNIQNQMSSSQNQMGNLQNPMSNIQNQIVNPQNLQSQMGNSQNQMNNLQSQMGNLQNQLGNTQNQLCSSQNQMGSCQNQMENSQNQLGNSQNQMVNPQNQINNSPSQMSNAQNQIGNSQNQIGNPQKQLGNSNHINNSQNAMDNPNEICNPNQMSASNQINNMQNPLVISNQVSNAQNPMGITNQVSNAQNPMGNTNQVSNAQNPMGITNQVSNAQNPMGITNQVSNAQNPMGITNQVSNAQNPMGISNQVSNAQNPMGITNQISNSQNAMHNTNQISNSQSPMGNPNQISNSQNTLGNSNQVSLQSQMGNPSQGNTLQNQVGSMQNSVPDSHSNVGNLQNAISNLQTSMGSISNSQTHMANMTSQGNRSQNQMGDSPNHVRNSQNLISNLPTQMGNLGSSYSGQMNLESSRSNSGATGQRSPYSGSYGANGASSGFGFQTMSLVNETKTEEAVIPNPSSMFSHFTSDGRLPVNQWGSSDEFPLNQQNVVKSEHTDKPAINSESNSVAKVDSPSSTSSEISPSTSHKISAAQDCVSLKETTECEIKKQDSPLSSVQQSCCSSDKATGMPNPNPDVQCNKSENETCNDSILQTDMKVDGSTSPCNEGSPKVKSTEGDSASASPKPEHKKNIEGTSEETKVEEIESPTKSVGTGEDESKDVGCGTTFDGKQFADLGTNTPKPFVKEDPGIPYDWATDLLKNYIPGSIANSAKMEVFFCILEESMALGDRMLVFSQSLFTLNLIEDFLQRNNLPGRQEKWARNWNYYRLDGSTTALEREKLINEYNSNPNIHLFLVSTRAGSLGINLVGANRVVVFDASWNPCHDTQAVCRVYRYGQKKPCFVYRLVMDNCLEKKIYDRQINKQGMADRVVDECNPDAHLSIKEVTNLCWDNEEDSEVRDFSKEKDKYIDVVMQKVLDKYSSALSKEPFQHESLLVDRKEKKLSQAEKRLAKRSYELEKQANINYNRPQYSYYPSPGMGNAGMQTSLQIRAIRTDGVGGAGVGTVPKPVASVRPMQAELMERGPRSTISTVNTGRSRWIPADVWQRQGMSAQEMTLPLDVVIPTNSPDRASIVLKAGQRVMVLKSPKGIYMQLENGKIIAIRTAFKVGGAGKGAAAQDYKATAAMNADKADIESKLADIKKEGNIPHVNRSNSKVSSVLPLKNNSAITIIPKNNPTLNVNRPKPFTTKPVMVKQEPGMKPWGGSCGQPARGRPTPVKPNPHPMAEAKPYFHHQGQSQLTAMAKPYFHHENSEARGSQSTHSSLSDDASSGAENMAAAALDGSSMCESENMLKSPSPSLDFQANVDSSFSRREDTEHDSGMSYEDLAQHPEKSNNFPQSRPLDSLGEDGNFPAENNSFQSDTGSWQSPQDRDSEGRSFQGISMHSGENKQGDGHKLPQSSPGSDQHGFQHLEYGTGQCHEQSSLTQTEVGSQETKISQPFSAKEMSPMTVNAAQTTKTSLKNYRHPFTHTQQKAMDSVNALDENVSTSVRSVEENPTSVSDHNLKPLSYSEQMLKSPGNFQSDMESSNNSFAGYERPDGSNLQVPDSMGSSQCQQSKNVIGQYDVNNAPGNFNTGVKPKHSNEFESIESSRTSGDGDRNKVSYIPNVTGQTQTNPQMSPDHLTLSKKGRPPKSSGPERGTSSADCPGSYEGTGSSHMKPYQTATTTTSSSQQLDQSNPPPQSSTTGFGSTVNNVSETQQGSSQSALIDGSKAYIPGYQPVDGTKQSTEPLPYTGSSYGQYLGGPGYYGFGQQAPSSMMQFGNPYYGDNQYERSLQGTQQNVQERTLEQSTQEKPLQQNMGRSQPQQSSATVTHKKDTVQMTSSEAKETKRDSKPSPSSAREDTRSVASPGSASGSRSGNNSARSTPANQGTNPTATSTDLPVGYTAPNFTPYGAGTSTPHQNPYESMVLNSYAPTTCQYNTPATANPFSSAAAAANYSGTLRPTGAANSVPPYGTPATYGGSVGYASGTPNQYDSDYARASMYSAFHRPEPHHFGPGPAELGSPFLASMAPPTNPSPFGLAPHHRSPHFTASPSASTQNSNYYPQNVYAPSPYSARPGYAATDPAYAVPYGTPAATSFSPFLNHHLHQHPYPSLQHPSTTAPAGTQGTTPGPTQ